MTHKIDGLWIVQYNGPKGDGGGVVVLTKGQVLGGDNGFTYIGSFNFKDPKLQARVSVRNFDSAIPNVLGVVGNFELLIEGTLERDTLTGTAALVDAPDAKMFVRLSRQFNLT